MSTEYEEVLLIGGPHDGARISVPAGIPTVEMPQRMQAPTQLYPVDANLPLVDKAVPHCRYERHPFHLPNSRGVRVVYKHEGMKEDPIMVLLAGYRPAYTVVTCAPIELGEGFALAGECSRCNNTGVQHLGYGLGYIPCPSCQGPSV